MLISGEFKPGEKLNIDELSRTFNISKTPIREVLKSFEQEGLLNYYPRVGWEVKKMNKEQYFNVVELQELLEIYLCQNIADYIKDINFDQLEAINNEIDEVIKNKEFHKLLELNEKFHLVIYDVYPNMKILDTLQNIWNSVRIQRNIMVTAPDFIKAIMDEHNEIIASLKSNNSEALVKACRKHFNSGKVSLNKYFDEIE
jgi:DNA-binding GntR family transcriptional regulator